MAFLRTLLWIAVTVIVVVFSVRNWSPVTINLFGDTVVETKLPMLMLVAFLMGFVPLYVWHRAVQWRHGRKLAQIERMPSTVVASPPSEPGAPPAAPTRTPFGDPIQDD